MLMPMRGGIITCDIKDAATLYKSYLPFVSGGALFVPSERSSSLGDDVFVAFTLPDSTERYPLNGKIVWINQKASASRPIGFAVQLGNDTNSLKLRHEVERLLAGQLDSEAHTFTM